jgi:hypothetical protein
VDQAKRVTFCNNFKTFLPDRRCRHQRQTARAGDDAGYPPPLLPACFLSGWSMALVSVPAKTRARCFASGVRLLAVTQLTAVLAAWGMLPFVLWHRASRFVPFPGLTNALSRSIACRAGRTLVTLAFPPINETSG